jgi:hypothetical protein
LLHPTKAAADCSHENTIPGKRLFELCRQKNYLPDLTKEEIEHYYNEFTEVRKQAYMSRYGSAGPVFFCDKLQDLSAAFCLVCK